MGRKFNKVMVIVFFPITIFFIFVRSIYRVIEKKAVSKALQNLSINQIDALDGVSFEDVLYYLFSSIGLDVEKTSKSHDYGADLIINYRGSKIVIQSKLYYNHNVGNSAIQEVATAVNFYSANVGMVITNSYFTKPAIIMADKVGIKLVDRNSLIELLNSSNSRREKIVLGLIGQMC